MEKQESVSRQSSILKPPKQRQPLQCVATNSPSSENSPTIKIKRRVSFAKNKRIREFCNEAEQGTVWDNTYEEHDLSNPKNNSNDHPVIISVPCDDKENFPVQLFLKNDELDCKEVPQSIPTEDGDNLSQSDMEMDNSINNSRPTRIGEQLSENQYENETIYCDDGMDMTNYIPSEIIPCQRHDNDGMDDHLPGPQSCIQNASMEITQNLPSVFSNNLIQHQTNDKPLLASNSTDLTQAISALLSGGCAKKLNNPTDLETPNAEPSKSTMDSSNTAAMEFTSVLPSSTWIRPSSRCQNDDRTENLTKTMEFTMAGPCSIQKAKNAYKSNGFSEETNIFTNRSMEMTEPVFTVNKDNNHEINAVMQEKTKIFLNNSMEMTKAVSIFDKIRQIENNLQPCTNSTVQEKTKIVVNNSMEMTEAVPTLDKIRLLDNNRQLLNSVVLQEKTKIFVDNSMEMTEAVPILDKIRQLNDNTQPLSKVTSQEKTKLFLNNSMEMTEAIPILNKVRQLDENTQSLNNMTTQEKTKIFLNNSMEMTEAIPILNKVRQLDDNTQHLNNVTSQEKTKIFLNNSMEMTEAIPILNKVRQLDENTQLLNNITKQEKTKIFLNNSMEMTEAVPISNKIHHVSCNEQPITNSTIQEKTKIFSNKSMEMTEAIPVYNNAANLTTHEKTKFFSNHSMEITEAVPIINNQFSDVEKLVYHSIPQEKTKVFANNSMEITAAVSVRQFPTEVERQIQLVPQEKTKVFINNSMEMTELIPGHVKNRQCVSQTDKSVHDITQNKTKIFANKSMEITQPIAICDKPSDCSKTILGEEGLGKTKIGLNMSMEMTEAVPVYNMIPSNISSLHNNTQEKTNIFLNKSMDVSETVPVLSKIRDATGVTKVETRQLLSEKTKLFSNTSMEMTEAITANRKYPDEEQSTQNKTRIFANKSIDILETIPVGDPSTYAEKIASESLKEGTNASRIDLIRTSNVIPIYHDSYEYKGNTNEVQRKSNKRYRQFDFEPTNERKKISPNIPLETKSTHWQEVEKTKVFLDKSMDVSETIPIQGTGNTNIGHYYNPSAITQEKTKLYRNTSMDMTEVISTHTKAYEPNHLLRENLNKDRTECFLNKSMDITENIPVKQIAFPILETEKMVDYIAQNRTKMFTNNSMNISETIPVHQHVSATNLNNQKTRVFFDKSMDMTEMVASNQSISQRRDVPHEATQNDNLTKVFHNATMEFTELPTSFPGTCNNSKPFNQSDFGASSNNVNAVQGSINVSNNFHKRSNYDISDRFSTRDESFHRITSDELNTLCASMNLPTQKYSRDESVNTQTNFIPLCNDVNVLRDSLQKNSMFQVPDQFNTENNSRVSNCSKNIRDPSLTQVRREGTVNMDLSVINKNEVDKSIATENYFNKSITAPVMDMDKTAEISLDHLEQQQTHCGLDQVKNQNDVFIEKSLTHPVNESLIVQSAANISNKNINNVYAAAEPEKLHNSEVQIYHDTSMELMTNPLTLLTTARSKKTNVPIIANCNQNENGATSRENSLTRLPSDNTDLLIATMGIKTKLTYPLIINDKTTIPISNKSLTSKSYSIGKNEESFIETDKTYLVDKNLINSRESSKLIGEKVQNEDRNFEISMVEDDKECDSSAKGNNEPGVETNIFSEKCLEELDEIQPPSFLDSDSMQDDDLSDQLERLSSGNRLDSILSNSNEQCALLDEAELKDNISFNDTMESSKHSEVEKEKRLSSSDSDYSFKNKSNEISSPKKGVHLSFTPVNNESKKDFIEEPISPFLSLTESLKAEEMRDDCIWGIRAMKPNIIAIDFISKSFVVILRLNEMETINCIRDVEKVEFVSRIRADSKNMLLKIVHRLLLLKFNPDKMINTYKMYEDILPMLQYISKEVVFFMNFMFDLERLSAMNLITMDIERITFMVSSRKSNIILKVLLKLKLFDEIGPNDIDVTCVLGDIRKNDIKQLIVNIKKGYKFLSRYITDVKDYITLMENHV